jgi:hypothetical protein
VIVAFALYVAIVESQLLRHREAVRHSSVDQSLGEGVLGIQELFLTFDIGLPTGVLGVEDDWMNIDLACAAPQRVQRARSPVRLHRVTMPAARLQQVIERHLSAIMAREDAPNRGQAIRSCRRRMPHAITTRARLAALLGGRGRSIAWLAFPGSTCRGPDLCPAGAVTTSALTT